MEDAAGGYWSKYFIADDGHGNGVCQLPPGKISLWLSPRIGPQGQKTDHKSLI
jgi:hypothetical protein